MKKSIELRQEREELLKKAQAIRELCELEKRAMADEEKTKFDSYCTQVERLHTDIEAEERAERLEKAKFEAALNVKPQVPRETQVADEKRIQVIGSDEYRDAFFQYVRGGMRSLRQEQAILLQNEHRAQGQSVGTTTAGGFTVPQGFQSAIEKALLTFGGMRQVARILNTDGGNDIPWPTVDDTSNKGRILGEFIQAPSTDIVFGQATLKAFKYTSDQVWVSTELLQDSGVPLESVLADLLGERVGRIQNEHFTTGTGTGQPQGVVVGAAEGVVGASGQTTSVTYDDLVDLIHSVDPAYRPGARFVLNDSSLAGVMKLRDSQGRPFFQPDSTGAESRTILGFPFTVNQDVASMAANAKSILFGDFSKYIIRNVSGFQLRRLDEVGADKGAVVFILFARADGRLLNAGTDPIKYYQNSAT